MPLRVLVTGEVLANARTGVEVYTAELLRALAPREDLQLTVLCRDDAHVADLDARIGRVVHRPRLGMLGDWLRSPRMLREFDVVHCPTVRTPFLRKPRGVKLVITVHDLVPLVAPEHHQWTYRVYFRHVLPRLLMQADAIVANSEATRKDLLAAWPLLPPITITPLGKRWETLGEGESPQHGTGRASGAPAEGVHAEKDDYLLAVGTREPRKNLMGVIRAFGLLKARRPELKTRLVIVGKAGWKDGLLQTFLAEKPFDIELAGYVPDEQLPALYQRARALVYPSFYEGFGLPVLEAMSMGCPVITSNVSSLPEVGGSAVLYVDPNRTDEIEAAMEKLLDDDSLARRLAADGLRRSAEFTWQRCAEQTAEVYRGVAESDSSGGRRS